MYMYVRCYISIYYVINAYKFEPYIAWILYIIFSYISALIKHVYEDDFNYVQIDWLFKNIYDSYSNTQ